MSAGSTDVRLAALYAAFAAALADPPDEAALKTVFGPRSAMHVGGLGREYVGVDAVIGFVATVRAMTGGTFRFDALALRADGDYGAASIKVRAVRPGKELDVDMVHLVRFDGDVVGDIWAAYGDDRAVASFWE
jgi:hypothetical protein